MERFIAYDDLDILFEQTGDAFWMRVIQSPSGETPELVRRIDRPETERVKKFGGDLYDALFHDDLKICLRRSLDASAARGHGLRLRLRLGDCPALLDVPWEFLYDRNSNRFVCLSHRTPVVRYLHLEQGPAPLRTTLPLRALVMISDPVDYERLNVGKEWDNLQVAAGPLREAGRLKFDLLPSATLPALQRALRDHDYHVFHFIGHGGFDPARREGALILETANGKGVEVSGQDIGAFLSDHPSLRLAVLNSCEGARSDWKDPFAGVAQTLIQQGLPAVIAMQFEITDSAAIVFAADFYSSIVAGLPVDAALAEARKAVYGQPNPVEWATPVLYMRSTDGALFHFRGGTSPPAGLEWQSEAAGGVPVPAAGTQAAGEQPEPQDGQGRGETTEHRPPARPWRPRRRADRAPGPSRPQPRVSTRQRLARHRHLLLALGTAVAVAGALAATLFLVFRDHPVAHPWATGGPVYSRPSRAGLVYAGSVDGKVYAFDPATGAARWRHATGSGIYSSPVVFNGAVIIGSTDGKVYSLRSGTGHPLWAPYQTGSPVRSSPAVDPHNGFVYVGNDDGDVYALSTATGRPVWKHPFPTGKQLQSTPVIDGGRVYVCSNSGKVYALDATTGKPVWKRPFATRPGYCGLVADTNSGVVYVSSVDHKVYALKADGRQYWTRPFTTGGVIRSSPTVNSGTVYVGSGDGNVYALNAFTGQRVWAKPVGDLYQSSPTAVGSSVYVGTDDGDVYALRTSNGAVRWQCHIGGFVRSTPAVVHGKIYVGSTNGKVHVLSQSNGCPSGSKSPGR